MRGVTTHTVRIPVGGGVAIEGDLTVPDGARGGVVFAHGSGSSRFSPRNRAVAAELQAAGFATLLVDLLTAEEERLDAETRQLRFDIELLAGRLEAAADFAAREPALRGLPLGFFGASTGAGAALAAAARRPSLVAAVVSRGGRPDLAGPALLAAVRAPTLLVVGGDDTVVIGMNRDAFGRLRCEARLEIVPGATHLFEEPGTLEQVARLARGWFERYLTGAGAIRTAL